VARVGIRGCGRCGNSIIGTEFVANAQPDGYTLLVISTSFTTNPIIHKLPYDPLKSFAWVAMLGFGPNVLAVTQKMAKWMQVARIAGIRGE